MLAILVVLVAGATACSPSETADTLPAELATTTTAATTTTTESPSTTTTSTTLAKPGIVPGEDADVDAVVLAYQIVFSSATGYEEKVPYLEDSEGLEGTVAAYQETGDSMGGVELVPTSVTISGDKADVAYDLLFGGTPTYPDLRGDAVLRDDTWKITRTMFCAMMASARVGCPES